MSEEKNQAARLLKTARGQIDGLLKMIEEDRYCIDISTQILAARAMLGKANREILRGHMAGCMKTAFASKDEAEQEKMLAELMAVMEKM